MATVQIRRPKNVWGNNLTLNYDISVSDVNTPQECPVPAKYLPDVECVERIQPIALQQHPQTKVYERKSKSNYCISWYYLISAFLLLIICAAILVKHYGLCDGPLALGFICRSRSKESKESSIGSAMLHKPFKNDSACIYKLMNNGNCNKINDNAICDFDGGDCTLEEWNDDIWNFFEIFGDYDGYDDYLDIYICPVVGSGDYMIGDKFCDDELNNPSCNYDGGDCCDQTISMIPSEPTNQPGKPPSQMNQLHPNQDGKPSKPNPSGKPPKPNQPGKPQSQIDQLHPSQDGKPSKPNPSGKPPKANQPGKPHTSNQPGKPHKSIQPGKPHKPNQPDEQYLNPLKPLKHLMWDAFCVECQCKA